MCWAALPENLFWNALFLCFIKFIFFDLLPDILSVILTCSVFPLTFTPCLKQDESKPQRSQAYTFNLETSMELVF